MSDETTPEATVASGAAGSPAAHTPTAAPAPERHAHFSAALACGVERWGIKR